ncbi:hypothetical protein QTL86_18115 [Cellulosilyticum sp. ST5]|uniref:Uncharacterized protein n=1 Tax=Cellulosilyticum lentocellum (strain ATCC 49066 / DSM 5427 / NCIMB 11756 / RHM5) TaxID=642492 RepID=F2JSK4_CELLD|nr:MULTISPECIES: hypothetical protein [Cellulosilyticum]ADZ81784.1 hypothetical protein Clole_0022 [Cellulosilyticum lentocellum DSM 5427]QEH67452.1 hypothetical protein EKH84_03030 [Cellulosilyticum sp. WCF-2]
MDKKQQLLQYLNSHLFLPVLESPYASSQLKYDFEHTRQTLEEFSAEGILFYIWNSFANSESQRILSNRLLDEGFINYEHTLDQFKNEYTYEWLMS